MAYELGKRIMLQSSCRIVAEAGVRLSWPQLMMHNPCYIHYTAVLANLLLLTDELTTVWIVFEFDGDMNAKQLRCSLPIQEAFSLTIHENDLLTKSSIFIYVLHAIFVSKWMNQLRDFTDVYSGHWRYVVFVIQWRSSFWTDKSPLYMSKLYVNLTSIWY